MRVSSPLRVLGAASAAWILLSSCSVLYDLSPDQCGSNSDCTSFGSGYRCEEGLCKSSTANAGRGGGGSGGDTAGDGGKSGGTPNGGTGGGTSGTAGTGGGPECTYHADCEEIHKGGDLEPRACVEGSCVLLKTDDCQTLLPALVDDGTPMWLTNLTTPETNAIILGAFTQVTGSITNQTRNYDLVARELTSEVTGLRGSEGETRPVVFVVCKSLYATTDDLMVAAGHLIDDLKVPGLITGVLPSDDIQALFDQKANDAGTFMISPNESDPALAALDDGGRVWNMLSAGDTLAVTYKPLLDRAIAYQESVKPIAAGTVRVALLLTNGIRFFGDIRNELISSLQFNGKSVFANQTANPPTFLTRAITASAPDQVETVNALLTFRPHVIISLNSTEFLTRIAPLVEDQWATGNTEQQQPPFYILSPYHYNNTDQGGVPGLLSPRATLGRRLIGINWPGDFTQSTYTDYITRFLSEFPEAASTTYNGFENYYDTAYYLLYATAAAGRPAELTGDDIARGMQRLLSGNTTIPVGPEDLVDGLALVQNSNADITLLGAMGPPNFDGNGARADPGSVWCMNSRAEFIADVLRYDDSGSSPTLTGSMSTCINTSF